MKKILIMNMTRMGDLIQSTPLIKGLKDKNIDVNMTLLVSSDFAEIARRIPCIDNIVVFNLRQFNQKREEGKLKSWVEVYQYLKKFLDEISKNEFDEVFNLSHSKLSALMLSYLEIPKVHGFFCNSTGDRLTFHPWLQYFGIEPFNRSYNSFNLADIYLKAGDIEPSLKQVDINTEKADMESAKAILKSEGINNEDLLIGIQAGSSLEGRRWPASSFSQLGDLLCTHLNAKVVLFGVESEAALAREIKDGMQMKDRVVNLSGKTSIPELIALLKRTRYLVTNDTGTMHIAAALGTYIIGLFFAHAHPVETGPYGAGHLIFQARIPCAPCSYGVTCNDIVCIDKVHPEDVFSMVQHHFERDEWQVGGNIEFPSELNIFKTDFDQDYLLKMRPLIKRPLTKRELLIMAYRQLWQETLNSKGIYANNLNRDLGGIIADVEQDYEIEPFSVLFDELNKVEGMIDELISCGKQGVDLTKQLSQKVKGGTPAGNSIQKFGDKINELDEKINQLGLTNPEIKPVTDIFGKRKENFCGDNIFTLSLETRTCYQKLVWEGERLKNIISSFLKTFGYQAKEAALQN